MTRARNLYPDRYRGVSMTHVDVALVESELRDFFVGRKAYFKTRFAVVRNGGGTAVLSVTKADGEELFRPIVDVIMLAEPDETAFVDAADVDTGIPSELARAAREHAPDHHAVVVHGKYEHVSFIVGAAPLRILVREVVPPAPAKLLDQARRVLSVREDLPPIELIADLIDLADLADANVASRYLLPCRGSGFERSDATVDFLDEHPTETDWTLLGCTRSEQIHRSFYGRDAPRVSICPLERAVGDTAVLTKCCLQDDELRSGDGWVSVPWGSSMQRVSEALDQVVRMSEVAWPPA